MLDAPSSINPGASTVISFETTPLNVVNILGSFFLLVYNIDCAGNKNLININIGDTGWGACLTHASYFGASIVGLASYMLITEIKYLLSINI